VRRRRQHGGVSGGGDSAKRGGGAQRNGGSAVAAARRLPQWRQRDSATSAGIGTVRKCADTHAFERHRRTDIRIFVLGRGWRDDSVDSIVVFGSDGVAHGDVHRGRRCAAAANDDADGDADDIVC